MPELPRQKRFQIHLSTAIVMMFVAGGIIWMNANAGSKVVGGGFSQHESYSLVAKKYGWPIEFGWSDLQRKVERYNNPEIEVPPDDRISWKPATVDLAVGFILLGVVCYFCEWLIRRRATRK